MQCQALQLSSEQRCAENAQDGKGLFCFFHSRQCHGLYQGYKRRNAKLDQLVQNPPHLLQGTALSALDLSKVEGEEHLQELRDHLFERYVLLDRVIRARRVHHTKFFSLELDYGHENFINQLSAQKTPLLRALEATVRRLAEVQFHQQKWFNWIRTLEDEDDLQRDTEKKKVKQEAALFQRHRKDIEQRQRLLQAREEQKRQEVYLEGVWKSLNQKDEEDGQSSDWDPIEDTIENEREVYLDLLRRFLWRASPLPVDAPGPDDNIAPSNVTSLASPTENTAKSKNARKKARQKANTKATQQGQVIPTAPGAVHVETTKEMQYRLLNPDQFQDNVQNLAVDPQTGERTILDRPAILTPEEIEKILVEVAEIKELLFCRLLLSRASLLRPALKATTIDEFLEDNEVDNFELRDLCLRMEQPGLQEIRDACADLKRAELAPDETDSSDTSQPKSKSLFPRGLKTAIPTHLQTKAEKKIKKQRDSSMQDVDEGFVDFGEIDDKGQFRVKRISVTVCGRRIFNYPSEKAMSRGGWLHFSILAKDCTASDAVKLCRSWDEFFELITLIKLNYFPATGWMGIMGQMTAQFMTLGFVPYFHIETAARYRNVSETLNSRFGPRQHRALETRNWICGIMKRNDPVTRRFIQHIVMRSSHVIMLVRDVSTGKVLVQPPSEQLWLVREKHGLGRMSRSEWNVIESVGPDFLEKLAKSRRWSLGFKDYYDIIIWDYESGLKLSTLEDILQIVLFKALRYQKPEDVYRPSEHILRSITYDYATHRSRDAQKGDITTWDEKTGPGAEMKTLALGETGPVQISDFPENLKYNEADRLEDEILFPDETSKTLSSDQSEPTPLLSTQGSKLHDFENLGLDIERFVFDLDSDEELADGALDRARNHFRELGDSPGSDSNNTMNDAASEHASEDSESQSDWDEMDDLDEEDPDNLTPEERVVFYEAEEAYFEWTTTCGLNLASRTSKDTSGTTTAQKAKLKRKIKAEMRKLGEEAMKEDFEIFVDRSQAAAFKDSWHSSDLEPGAPERWSEYRALLKSWSCWRVEEAPVITRLNCMKQLWQLLSSLQVHPRSHHRVIRDMRNALDMTDLFFGYPSDVFFSSDFGKAYKSSQLIDQRDRAQQLPQRRTPHSNKTRLESDWKPWDEALGAYPPNHHCDALPEKWNATLRPIIAKLYRGGVICPAYISRTAGVTVCLTEEERPSTPDLFFDWRQSVADMKPIGPMSNPFQITPLQEQARKYAEANPDARFTVLKLWSAPHFWPLMIGYDKRDSLSFFDGLERAWHWKFVPKDMGFSEWSIHRIASMRFDAYRDFFSDRTDGCEVVHRKDMFLVMAKNEHYCRWYTAATIYAVQTRPWRLDIDPWKSWFNVDADFLGQLHKKWWE